MSSGMASHPCKVATATGFFYEGNGNKYLVTNRHVLLQEERKFYPDSLKIRVHTGPTSWENRDVSISLYGDDQNPKWLEHPLNLNYPEPEKVDVVAININSYVTSSDYITYWSRNYFLPEDEILSLGHQVLVVGYPWGFYDEHHNFPITKSGTLASPYRIYFQTKPVFLVEANLPPGTSGSPVILPHRSIRQLRNIGVSIETEPTPANLLGVFSAEHVGLGLNRVWYPSLIEDILSG